MDPIKFDRVIILKPGEGVLIESVPEQGESVVYEVCQPTFAQDDGMGGNLVIRCAAQGPDATEDTLSYVGGPDIHNDFGLGEDDGPTTGRFLGEDEKTVVGRWGVNFVRIAPTTY